MAMKFVIDQDYHIHSKLSPCSNDPLQTVDAILAYGEKAGMKDIVVTDHFWDKSVPTPKPFWSGFDLIEQNLPLPQGEHTRFHFGCEADMDRFSVIGFNRKNADRLEFIIVPINHLHFNDYTIAPCDFDDLKRRADCYVQRFWNFLQMDYPFRKMGIAHLTDGLVAGGMKNGTFENHLAILDMVADDTFRILFEQVAERGLGVELNVATERYEGANRERMLRPYRIAKACGCKFYTGSDAHHPAGFESGLRHMHDMVAWLDLDEEDKFKPFG
jgi:histidinol phosphatase-like PHP family hydrolase